MLENLRDALEMLERAEKNEYKIAEIYERKMYFTPNTPEAKELGKILEEAYEITWKALMLAVKSVQELTNNAIDLNTAKKIVMFKRNELMKVIAE